MNIEIKTFGEYAMTKFAYFLELNNMKIIKSNPKGRMEKYSAPESVEDKCKLLDDIIEALNDGFYSDESCIAFIYNLIDAYNNKSK